jgi:hypothetical protein
MQFSDSKATWLFCRDLSRSSHSDEISIKIIKEKVRDHSHKKGIFKEVNNVLATKGVNFLKMVLT